MPQFQCLSILFYAIGELTRGRVILEEKKWRIDRRLLADFRAQAGVSCKEPGSVLSAAFPVDFQEYGTRPVQKHGTPESRPLT
jgi:hypothetical protein